MILELILFVSGFILLTKGSDYFVKSSSIIAKRIGISEFVIGLTLVAVGTSLPELASCIFAAFKKESLIITGEIIGSNITNIGLVGGIMAITSVTNTKLKKHLINRDGYLMIFSQILLLIFLIDLRITKYEGLIFLFLYIAYLIFLFNEENIPKEKQSLKEFLRYFIVLGYIDSIADQLKNNKNKKIDSRKLYDRTMIKQALVLLLGSLAIFIGSKFLIEEAIFFSEILGIGKNIIALTIIALGTSLPELSVSISAARKGLSHIAAGNIVGSSIANILLIIGSAAIINPIISSPIAFIYTIPFMIFISLVFVLMSKKKSGINRFNGAMLILLYVLFIISLIVIKDFV